MGVGTLLACREYHRIGNCDGIVWRDYPEADDGYIKAVFGERLSGSIIEENSKDCASGIKAKDIEAHLTKIREIIDSIPKYDELIEIYETIGVKSRLADIDVPEALTKTLLEYSPLVRNRVTLMRLRRCIMSEV